MRKLLIFGLLLCLSWSVQAEEYGVASYYSDAFHGRSTASGELYHKDKLTAAHKTLPFGTIIKVTRLDNKKSVTVRVNDRGPYIKGRIVDLSKAAAVKLDLITDGKARVKVEIVEKGEESLAAESSNGFDFSSLRSDEKKEADKKEEETQIPDEFNTKSPGRIVPKNEESQPAPPKTNVKPKGADVPNLKVDKSAKSKKSVEVKKTATPKVVAPTPSAPAPAISEAVMVRGAQDYQTHDLYKIQLMRPAKSGYGVQVASLTSYDNVMRQVADLQGKWFNNILMSVEKDSKGEIMYKLILGPFPDRNTADSYKKELKSKKKMNGFVVDLSTLKN